MLTPVQHEQVLHWLHEYARSAPFHVRTIAAQHYRRVVIQSRNAASTSTEPRWEYTGAGFSARVHKRASATRGVNDGNGFCFVSHVGDVYPSGFLQIKAGNVREQTLSQIYRDSPLFRSLRDPSRLKGKCGVCEYRAVCGGSRARAFAMTGDHLASDPSCVYTPPAIAS